MSERAVADTAEMGEAGGARGSWWAPVSAVLGLVGSPCLTTTLFVLAILLIFLGTLAQVYQDMWAVIDSYFRSWWVQVDLKVLFPPSFFPWSIHTDWDALRISRFPFPGGALIGTLLFVNLLAAHTTRFTVKARGARLVLGLVVLAAGCTTTWLVIASGHNRQGIQGEPLLDWHILWLLIQIALAAVWLVCVVGCVYVWRSQRPGRRYEFALLAAMSLGLAVLLAWIVMQGEAGELTDSSLRILYQLIQSQIAASVLLLACVLLFYRRAGLVLLHGGVGLLMFGEFFVSHFAAEQQMTLVEGSTVDYARDIRSVELAIQVPTGGERQQVIAVPLMTTGTLTQFAEGTVIRNEALPFDAQVVRYLKNSIVRRAEPGEANPADKGMGSRFLAEPAPQRGGMQGGRMDVASAYVTFTGKADGKVRGTYLLSQHFGSRMLTEALAVDGQSYGFSLRFKRANKPYQLTLLDIRKDDYVGTSMPRNYSSQVRLKDPSRNVEFETKIWMNNPLRYAGETFYQSGYNVDGQGVESSTLQIVRNTGWMIPYVSCMIAATGMLTHFLLLLLRFLQRVPAETVAGESGDGATAVVPVRGNRLVPILVVGLGVLWMASKAMPPRTPEADMDLAAFGRLPLMFEGRVKPFDTLARNSLRILSNRETYLDATGEKQPAIRWLLDVIARPSEAEKAPVFRIESLEMLETLGLQRRPGFRYSWEELRAGTVAFQRQLSQAGGRPPEERTFYERKLLELAQRIQRYRTLADSFRPLPFPEFPDAEAIARNREEAMRTVKTIGQLADQVSATNRVLMSLQGPLAAPVGPAAQPWQVYAVAANLAYVERNYHQQEPSPVLTGLTNVFNAYCAGDAMVFNQAVSAYEKLLDAVPPAGFVPRTVNYEAYLNHVAPFYNLIPLYVLALLLTVFGWLFSAWPRVSATLRSSAFWLVVLAFVVHTWALAARVTISGRPPVTNLYSSAIFIGWGCVLIGLFLEWVFRLGIGNLVSAVSGIGALLVAHYLAGDGDTIRVLQAVLDTQFWLTVHVLTVTLGYSATFLAGILGIVLVAWYVLGQPLRWLLRRLRGTAAPSSGPGPLEATLAQMIFGSICFAAFLSFVGTVLGGLWADDSWGRFWGWDPKENGALIIVLWTTLVLHARAARFVGDRGMALLAVGGNVVTAWSWFGVNELGVGLHSYGFTEGAARALLLFWISQLLIIGLGMLPVLIGWWRGGEAGPTPANP